MANVFDSLLQNKEYLVGGNDKCAYADLPFILYYRRTREFLFQSCSQSIIRSVPTGLVGSSVSRLKLACKRRTRTILLLWQSSKSMNEDMTT